MFIVLLLLLSLPATAWVPTYNISLFFTHIKTRVCVYSIYEARIYYYVAAISDHNNYYCGRMKGKVAATGTLYVHMYKIQPLLYY